MWPCGYEGLYGHVGVRVCGQVGVRVCGCVGVRMRLNSMATCDRSEMHLPIVSVRFGLMLEAYCRGCGETQMAALTSGLTALNKMEQVLSDTASQL